MSAREKPIRSLAVAESTVRGLGKWLFVWLVADGWC
jgi:hypothetical protein